MTSDVFHHSCMAQYLLERIAVLSPNMMGDQFHVKTNVYLCRLTLCFYCERN